MKKDLDKDKPGEKAEKADGFYARLYDTRIGTPASIVPRNRLPRSCQTLLRRIASVHQQQMTCHKRRIIRG
jgi:hypothetical protein